MIRQVPIEARRRARFGGLLAAPAGILLVALLIGPSLGVLWLSLTDYRLGFGGMQFVGLDNFGRLLADAAVAKSLVNTASYALAVVPLSIFGALWLAILLASLGRMAGTLQTVFFLPVTATLVAMATAWEVILHPSYGLANRLLAGLGLPDQRFLSDPDLALWSLALIGVWKTLGYNVVLFLAGIASIDRQLYEAAALDGAPSGWNRFATITWPQLAPVTLFVTVITTIRALSEFDTVAVLTRGGPNGASEMLLYTIFREGFRFFEIGYASALAVVFLLAMLALALIQIGLAERSRGRAR